MRLPHLLFVDDLYAGMMRGDEAVMQVPQGRYGLRVQCGGRIPIGKNGRSIDVSVSGRKEDLEVKGDTLVEFRDREGVWNLLFDVDMAVWIVSLFVAMPKTYIVISDVFFAVWLVRLVLVRKRYYRIKVIEQK